MRPALFRFLPVVILLAAPVVNAQEPAPASETVASSLAREREEERGSRDVFPDLNLYLPEGEFDIRLRKLIKNVLFEGQVNYNFVDGDVSTFLRYKYYARKYTYKIGLFDTLEFDSLESGSDDFDRTRGALLLFEFPVEYNRRYLALLQTDALSFGDVTNVDHDQDNFYLKLGYQIGTPFDERLNGIVGETRGRITPVLTAYREIGPQKTGVAAAITHSLDFAGSDYEYTKLEAEGLKRLDFGETFMISRLHVGSVLSSSRIEGREELDLDEQFTIPRYELFRIGGRDALKGLDDHRRGADEIHLSNEFFYPIFRNRDYETWWLSWNNLYGIAYVGSGSVGFGADTFSELDGYAVDAGLGFEASLTFRDYEIFLSAVYARTVAGPEILENDEIRFSARTIR
ncbi:MAG: hypothetical protein KY432_10465 [Acidobacteria bacterium]|nr:hypothetical protein [Acidobacteriota bacterium]